MATYEAQVRFLRSAPAGDDVMTNVLHFDVPGAPHDQLTAVNVGKAAEEAFISVPAGGTTHLMAHVHTSVQLQEVRVYKAGEEGEPLHVEPTAFNGLATTALLPPQVAASLTFRTESRRRWGRLYLGGLTTAQVNTTGRFTAAFMLSLVRAGLLLGTKARGYGLWHRVFSRDMHTAVPILRYVVDDVPDVIRSRRWGTTDARSELAAPLT